MKTILKYCAVLVGALFAPTVSYANCWIAEDLGVKGPAVEICYAGLCETTTMSLECAGSWGATIRYENGWSLNTELKGGTERSWISRNDTVLTTSQLEQISCTDLDADQGCRFAPFITRASAVEITSDPQTDLALIKQHFNQAFGVDAEAVQIALMEANLYHSGIDGQWGPSMANAFGSALGWAKSTGLRYDLSTTDGFYNFVWAVRDGLFYLDSGLGRSPKGGEYFLVTASRRDFNAALDLSIALDRRLRERGYYSLAYPLSAVNGWVAVVAGMYSKSGCEAQLENFKRLGAIPSDSYCAGLERFDPMNWRY